MPVNQISNNAYGSVNLSNKNILTDAWGRNKVVNDISLIHAMFSTTIPISTWKSLHDGVEQTAITGATSVDGLLNLSSSALNQKIGLATLQHPRYEPNRGHLYSSSVILTNTGALAERSFGMFTSEAGVCFRLRAGVLYAVRRTTVSGVTTDIEEIITVPSTIDLSKGNIYDIQMQWRGVGSFFFSINQIPVHTMAMLGTLDGLSIMNPALPIAFEVINQGDAVALKCGCVDVTSEGGKDNGKTYGAVSISSNTGSTAISGYNIPILAVHSKELVNGLLNTRDTTALRFSAYADQRCVLRAWVTRDNTAVTLNDQAWADYKDGHLESLEYNIPPVATAMTFDTTKAELLYSARVNQDVTLPVNAIFSGITRIPHHVGDTLVFTMHRETGGAALVGVTYEFAEAI